MSDKKQPSKKRWVPEPGAPHMRPQRQAAAELKQRVLDASDEIFDRYVLGESLQSIAQSLPFKIADWKLRTILMESEETRDLYATADINRAHALVEQALDHGRMAAALGDSAGLRTAIDVNLKVAAKLAPRQYGDTSKLEVTGKDGGPIKMVALTDEQLMEIAARGKEAAA